MLPWTYALRNLWRRRARTVLTILGIAAISLLVILMTGFARGLSASAATTASPEVLVLTGNANEHDLVRSVIGRRAAETVAAKIPGVVTVEGVRAASPEIHIATRKGDVIGLMRGVTPAAFVVHDRVTLVEGREPQGFRELIVGRLAAVRMGLAPEDLAIGATIELEDVPWTVVGAFAAPGTVLEAELWGRLDDVVEATQRTDLSCVATRFATEDDADLARVWVYRNGVAYEVAAIKETELYGTLEQALLPLARLAELMALLILVGGVFACANTMFAAVLSRGREIGALRAIGYGPTAIGVSLLQESLLLALVGGTVGFWAASLFGDVPLKFPMGAFTLDLSPTVRVAGLLAAALIGIVGGLVPAWRAWRLPIPQALGGKV